MGLRRRCHTEKQEEGRERKGTDGRRESSARWHTCMTVHVSQHGSTMWSSSEPTFSPQNGTVPLRILISQQQACFRTTSHNFLRIIFGAFWATNKGYMTFRAGWSLWPDSLNRKLSALFGRICLACHVWTETHEPQQKNSTATVTKKTAGVRWRGRGRAKSPEEEAAFQISPRRREALPSLMEQNNTATGRHSENILRLTNCYFLIVRHRTRRCVLKERDESRAQRRSTMWVSCSFCASALCLSLCLFPSAKRVTFSPAAASSFGRCGGSREHRVAVRSTCGRVHVKVRRCRWLMDLVAVGGRG